MLSYEEFKNKISTEILDYLPDEYSDYEVKIVPTLKNNEKNLDGLLIKDSKSNIAPNIYLNDFYDAYREGVTIKEIFEKIAEIRTMTDPGSDVDPMKVLEYKNVKDHIYVCLVNYDLNRKYLSERPFRRFMDLAVLYYVNISECDLMHNMDGRMIMCITNDLLKGYKVTEDELYKTAVKNTGRQGKYVIKNVRDEVVNLRIEHLLSEGLDEMTAIENANEEFDDPDCDMMVLSNIEGLRGAAVILCKKILKEAAGIVGGDFYILPSSVDEVFILPFKSVPNEEQLIDMVYEANSPVRGTDKYLSDNVYFYDAKKCEIGIAKSSACHK